MSLQALPYFLDFESVWQELDVSETKESRGTFISRGVDRLRCDWTCQRLESLWELWVTVVSRDSLVHAEAGRVGELHRDATSGRSVVGPSPDSPADAERRSAHLVRRIPRPRVCDPARPLSQSDISPAGRCVLTADTPAHAQFAV